MGGTCVHHQAFINTDNVIVINDLYLMKGMYICSVAFGKEECLSYWLLHKSGEQDALFLCIVQSFPGHGASLYLARCIRIVWMVLGDGKHRAYHRQRAYLLKPEMHRIFF